MVEFMEYILEGYPFVLTFFIQFYTMVSTLYVPELVGRRGRVIVCLKIAF